MYPLPTKYTFTHVYTSIRKHTQAQTHTSTSAHNHKHRQAHTPTRTHAQVRAHKRTHMCAHTYICIRAQVQSHITYKHTHAHTIMHVNSLSVVSFVICFFSIINYLYIYFYNFNFWIKDTLCTCFQPLSPLFCCSSVFYIQLCPFKLIIMYLSVSE